jgi:hypothetical protein
MPFDVEQEVSDSLFALTKINDPDEHTRINYA